MKPIVPKKTLRHLEWARLLEHLSDLCSGEVAAKAALELDFEENLQKVKYSQRLTSEARDLIDGGAPPMLGQPPRIAAYLGAAARGSVLEAGELRLIGVHLETAALLRQYFTPIMDRVPALASIAGDLASLPTLGRTLLDAFDETGEISDFASGDLGELRQRVTSCHEQLKSRIGSMLEDTEIKNMLQDEYFTIREDRYVLPIRSGHKRHVPGIVHGWSGSGATVYIEPQPVVEANNRLLLAQADVDREVRRILTKLSAQVGENAEEIKRSVRALDAIDLAMAKGYLSKELDCVEPEWDDHELFLRQARHPLLALGGVKVVPNDIALREEQNVLVITGPNTGGKTVALKTTGILCLMALAGLHVPAQYGTKLPFLPGIFTDIGDEQSLDEAHSTFSGHIANIKKIFEGIQPGSLVLLDELVVGTDPLQGAALAQAILESLADRESLVLVTTHYESLKALPFEDKRFRNGAVGFDAEKHLPTFMLSLDLPGASSALVTARRLGLDPWIVQRASELAGPEQRQLEQVIQRLEREANEAEKERRTLAAERRKLEVARKQAEHDAARLKERIKAGIQKERNEAWDEARKLRDELKRLKAKFSEAQASEEQTQKHYSQVQGIIGKIYDAQDADRRKEAGPPVKTNLLKVGRKVFVVSLGAEAELVSMPDSKGRCEVRQGIITARVPLEDLRIKGQPVVQKVDKAVEKLQQSRVPVYTRPVFTWENIPPQSPDLTIDVRGYRADEAMEAVEAFLDTLYEREAGAGYIIHGHGTGALKRELRLHLPQCTYVKDLRRGGHYEGGDGVTVVLLQ